MPGFTADDSSPAMARKIGTPALLKVNICLENNNTSMSHTAGRVNDVHQLGPCELAMGSLLMSTGTTPCASNCWATLCSLRASN